MLLHPNSKPEYSVTSVTNLIVTSQSQIVLFFFLIMTFKGGGVGRYF